MRVITGSARGVRLETLPGEATRPTTDRVKEALFSAVQFDVDGRRTLDLFAGSGQLGIEALSRGAASCVFVDCAAAAVRVVRRNLETAGLADRARVVCADALDYLRRAGEPFDLVLLDPPYAAGLMVPALTAVELLLAPGALVMAETDDRTELPERVGRLTLERRYRFGKICLRKYVEASE